MRQVININDNWMFYLLNGDSAESVTLPHTWNNLDGQDGGNDYIRGTSRYERNIDDLPYSDDERVYIEFKAIHNIADVYLNDIKLGHHDCGFSTFRVDATDALQEQNNKLVVYVNNERTTNTYPQFADFTFFGGIYRDVDIVIVPKNHISLDDNGACGVRTWTEVKDSRGYVSQQTSICGNGSIVSTLADAEGNVVASEIGSDSVLSVDNPHLWDGLDDPYLYKLKVELVLDGQQIDEVELSVGFRTYYVDPEKGFFLNGRSYPLRGVCRHQDRQDKGWAISKKDHDEDMSLILEIGANTIRLSHYQHDQYFYDLCDRYGLVVWAEIPYISGHLEKGRQNTLDMMRELILQNMHHPSIICWGLSNEISMFGLSSDVYENHVALNNLCHSMDRTRLTVMANLGALPITDKLVSLPDLESYNIYKGWYLDDIEGNGTFLDTFHKINPNLTIGFSEYGAEALTSLHSENPMRGDYSEEYQALYHERLLEIFSSRPFIWATHVWNMFDFAADRRNEGGVQGRNNKGLVSYDRKIKKDSFYVYKAWWSKKPFVYVNGKRFTNRATDIVNIKVYSNIDKVDLYIDGNFVESKEGAHVFNFSVPLNKNGDTRVEAHADGCSDYTLFHHVDSPDPSYSVDCKIGSMRNWFEIDCKKYGFVYKDGYFSIKDSFDDIWKNEDAKSTVEDFFVEIAKTIGVSLEQLKDIALKGNLASVYSLMSMSNVPNSMNRFLVLNNSLGEISK